MQLDRKKRQSRRAHSFGANGDERLGVVPVHIRNVGRSVEFFEHFEIVARRNT